MSFAGLTYRLVDLWLKSFSKVRVLGPLTVNSPEYARVLKFRSEQNQKRAPYLEAPFQISLEKKLQLDERSFHFAIENDGEIVACVRATPAPFELSALAREFAENSRQYQDYYEFGRLCTDTTLERKGFFAGLLVVRASHYLFSNEHAKGILGICKLDRVAYMQKLGLHVSAESVRLAERSSDYQFIHASKDELLSYYFKRVFRIFSKTPSTLPETAEVANEAQSA